MTDEGSITGAGEKIYVRVPASVGEALRLACARKRISKPKAMALAIECWLKQEGLPASTLTSGKEFPESTKSAPQVPEIGYAELRPRLASIDSNLAKILQELQGSHATGTPKEDRGSRGSAAGGDSGDFVQELVGPIGQTVDHLKRDLERMQGRITEALAGDAVRNIKGDPAHRRGKPKAEQPARDSGSGHLPKRNRLGNG